MKILIADDDRISRILLSKILENEPGCSVVEAMNGGDAWRYLANGERPDLCLFDIMMPEMDGLDLLRKMRADERFKNVPVIFCTALNERNAVIQAAMLSVNYYIVKPYAESLVLDQVRKVKRALLQGEVNQNEAQVCTRLGIDRVVYRELMLQLAKDVTELVAKVKDALLLRDLKQAALLVNSIKGAATNMGTTLLVEELNWLESTLVSYGTSLFGGGVNTYDRAVFESWQKLHGDGVKNSLTRLQETATKLAADFAPIEDAAAMMTTKVEDPSGAEVQS